MTLTHCRALCTKMTKETVNKTSRSRAYCQKMGASLHPGDSLHLKEHKRPVRPSCAVQEALLNASRYMHGNVTQASGLT